MKLFDLLGCEGEVTSALVAKLKDLIGWQRLLLRAVTRGNAGNNREDCYMKPAGV